MTHAEEEAWFEHHFYGVLPLEKEVCGRYENRRTRDVFAGWCSRAKAGKYLLGKKTAHIWRGTDTACRMASTGGLVMKNYRLSFTAEGKDICHMCGNNEAGGG